ncbi:hypothetical protein [Streptomyces sp. NPDC005302]|uniref:hypothetical protein n=1 Tax=Streptomyces sp. NPDC005302 TaxID=3154675 RepID=UPI0033B37D3F
MTAYIARCRDRSSDYIVATKRGADVELEMHVFGDYQGEVFANPADARTFARGILALADEIDGGEVKEAPAVDAPTRSYRAKYVVEACELLENLAPDADAITRLAEFLAAGK